MSGEGGMTVRLVGVGRSLRDALGTSEVALCCSEEGVWQHEIQLAGSLEGKSPMS